MNILYFAWLKDRVGVDMETVTPPETVTNLAALADWLVTLSDGHAAAFEDRKAIRAAVNQDFADWDTPVKPGDEVAFFPPVTGG